MILIPVCLILEIARQLGLFILTIISEPFTNRRRLQIVNLGLKTYFNGAFLELGGELSDFLSYYDIIKFSTI